jgi:hypothetical protein
MRYNFIFYIVVHSIGIIEHFEKTNKYSNLKNYKYLLVGNHQQNYTSDKIIQCNLLPTNFEHYKFLLAYTGWCAVAYNKELQSDYDYFFLLEYDTDVDDNFNIDEFVCKVNKLDVDVCGLTQMSTRIGLLENSHFTTKLISFLVETKNINIKSNNKNWLTTNNMMFKSDFLKRYLDDNFTKQFIEYVKEDKMAGHYLERFLSIYCFLNSVKFDVIDNPGLTHRGFDSHETQNIYHSHRGYEQFKTINQISD